MWNHRGQQRPDFAVEPEPGQESAWDYPRPPVARRDRRLIEVRNGDVLLARSNRSYRVMETASPPSFYVPGDSVTWDQLVKVDGNSVCEWKGAATYWSLAGNPQAPVAWSYPRPRARFDMIRNFVSFYPGRVACFVDGERVNTQPGHFYGGWITSEVVGPFKGEPGTGHW
jgi:uncharacterized protein (DUF427 family)